MRKTLIFFLLIIGLIPFNSLATHNRAGEITYEHISGLTYLITVSTYTNNKSFSADRCELEVFYGDGTSDFIPRTNGAPCSGDFPSCDHCGENIGNEIKVNYYQKQHTFPGTGTYRISMEDPNRNAGVINIPNSINVVFHIYAELIIFPSGLPNSSPFLHYPPIDNACAGIVYEHNPGAVDQDISNNGSSDSLTYSLVTCLGNGGSPIAGYTLPDMHPSGPNNNISIDSQTGTVTWDNPKIKGEYNLAILIEEWRKVNGIPIRVGSVLRDLQIEVYDGCTSANNPPEIQDVADTCVTATKTLIQDVTAIDGDISNGNFQIVTLQGKGDPFEVQGNKATFPRKSEEKEVTSTFTWNTQCNHIRSYPYFVVFRASDSPGTVQLVDYYDWRISVNAPAPTNINAEPIGEGINVTWGYNTCNNAIGYRIYRKMDSIGYVAPNCETGIPSSTGYKLIGTSNGVSNTSFFDSDNGNGLISGQKYCYMVYAIFDDGAESYPSFETCATLRKEVPIITRVSVNTTSITSGSDTVKWSKPTDIDEIKFPGPYKYKVLRSDNEQDFSEVFETNENIDLQLVDTVFVDSGLNTQELKYEYRIEVYSNDVLVGPSRIASSPWLMAKPLDNRLELSLDINVPWHNDSMIIYRESSPGVFSYLGSSSSLIYTDSNLVNGKEYCYYITTFGQYSDTSLEHPLINHSQILCAVPIDKQAPCAPQNLEIDSDCELFYNNLSWLNPNDICDTTDDVVSYNIYFRPTSEGTSEIMETVLGATNTSISFIDLESVAGCYSITAVDSFNNESEMSNTVCVDNCPYYELPNIFTPGEDGKNDFFVPLPKWRYVKEVDMRLYNRWGEEIYSTTKPELGWDGISADGEIMSDGVYYYVCTVFEIRLSGIVERVLKGTLTLQREESGKPSN